ncbi:MAG TPA: hypothetical protein VKZ58_11640, partial [Longimicrobiales bacterium]|nr:hypothetical protein [Longimicrobiales bacterium]
GVGDFGVGRVTDITYYAALASVAATPNQVVAIGDVITTGNDLPETEFNNVYRVAVYLCDALLNCAAYGLNTLIGVDKTAPPDLRFAAGTVADKAINPSASSQFIIDPIADDYASGYGQNSLLATLVFNFGEACVVGTGASCAPRPLGDVKAYTAYAPSWPDYAEGYYTFTALARDKAGNRTNPITRTVLMDNTPPVAGTISVPAIMKGGEPATFGVLLQDNVDLRDVSFRLMFTPGDPFELPLLPRIQISDFGAPIVRRQYVEATFPFPRAAYGAGAGGVVDPTPLPAVKVRVRATDVAGNSLVADRDLAPISVEETDGPPPGLQTFRMLPSLDGAVVCGGLSGACGATTPNRITLVVQATGPSGTFANPFEQVYFFRKSIDLIGELIGTAETVTVSDDGTTRTWTYTITFDPMALGGLPAQVDATMYAVGIAADGDFVVTDWDATIDVIIE